MHGQEHTVLNWNGNVQVSVVSKISTSVILEIPSEALGLIELTGKMVSPSACVI
jgi:hypothetical protein